MTPLILRTITDVAPGGIPVLEGENRQVVAVQRFDRSHIGRQAVCQPATSDDATIVALGILQSADEAAPDGLPHPLVLQCGASSLTLAPDGSIRLEGRDFGLRVQNGVRINGATIDLN